MPPRPAFTETLQRAFTLHQANRLAEAEPLYRNLIDENPRDFNLLHLLGLVCFQTQRYDEADQLIGKALEVDPTDASASSNHGLVLLKLNQPEAALKRFADALEGDPTSQAAATNYAAALNALGRYGEALEWCERAVSEHPDFSQAYTMRGQILHHLLRNEDALESFAKALALAPDDVTAIAGMAACSRALDRPEDTARHTAALLALDPSNSDGLLFRAQQLEASGNLEEALQVLDDAPSGNSADTRLLVARARLLGRVESYGAALDACDLALAREPRNVEAMFLRGIALEAMQDYPGALQQYQQAIAVDPTHAPAHWNECQCQLKLGMLAAGFRNYEWRWKIPYLKKAPQAFAEPLWLGDFNIEGKKLLIHPEQGFGDTFHFLRYVALVRAKGADVIVEVQPGIAPLISGWFAKGKLFETGETLPTFDAHCPFPSLPLACGTDESSIPGETPYLHSDPDRVRQWKSTLGDAKGLRVGIAWSGNRVHVNDHHRSIMLEEFATAFSERDELICLQKEIREEDRPALAKKPGIRVFADSLRDFADTAALIELVDVVVTIDTGVAHLAAAMNKPTWILVDTVSDWRWQRDRTDSPWYPTVKLYRQTIPKRWKEVLTHVHHDLKELRGPRRGLMSLLSRR